MKNMARLQQWSIALAASMLALPQTAVARESHPLGGSMGQVMNRLKSAGICSKIDLYRSGCLLTSTRNWVSGYRFKPWHAPFVGVEVEIPLAGHDPRIRKGEDVRGRRAVRRLMHYLFPHWQGRETWLRRSVAFARVPQGMADIPIMAKRVGGYVVMAHVQPKFDMDEIFYDLVICRPDAVSYYSEDFIMPKKY
jgi:hypothetical protein